MPEFLNKNFTSSSEMCKNLLEKTGVALLPGSNFGISKNKMIARLNAMRYVLSSFDYPGKKPLKDKKWSKEIPEYSIEIDGVKFKSLTKEQYELLYRLKGST